MDSPPSPVVLTPASSSPSPPPLDSLQLEDVSLKPLRILILGDSMTQGQEGDHTWRYRLWHWLSHQSLTRPIKFVGPYAGTMTPNPISPLPDPNINAAGGYALDVDPEFDSRHCSGWGWAAWQMKGMVHDLVMKWKPDLVLCMLGFNDMGWNVSDAAGTLESIRDIVLNARKVNPKLNFAVANVPQRRKMDGREDLIVQTDLCNAGLEAVVKLLGTKEGKVHLVRLKEGYACGPDSCEGGYDGLHPNMLGEWQIARAFSKALVEGFGLGVRVLEVPRVIPKRVLPVPVGLRVRCMKGKVIANWERVYGAYGYDIQHGRSTDKKLHEGVAVLNQWESDWVPTAGVYEVRIRSQAGEVEKSEWTAIESVSARGMVFEDG
ncbi:hypothetical protein B0A48_06827 [Cryoendolithus antarcticus]|uniref:Uncharacterized protein n=1 Tax=Cryoendolithus antarcticus TaxID=1507870 RepID=A0A1V8T9T3_9PEZI|nr:hypothetical protein B0A48_06827 [Cryoendolithus antarcticus]